MNTYKITLKVDNGETAQNWSGWDEKTAIAQAFLYCAKSGARSVEVLSIELK